MNLNMTVADIVVSFVIGAIASLIILLFSNKISNCQRAVADWFAKRSIDTTRKRIDKIEKEIERIESVSADFNQMYKYVELRKLAMHVSFASAVFFISSCILLVINKNFFMQLGVTLDALVPFVSVESPISLVDAEQKLGYMSIFMFMMGYGFLFKGMFSAFHAIRFIRAKYFVKKLQNSLNSLKESLNDDVADEKAFNVCNNDE